MEVGLTLDDMTLEEGQPGGAVAKPAPCVVVVAAIYEGADHEICARRQHVNWDIRGCGCIELRRPKRRAVGEVLWKRTRIRAGVGWQLSDYFFMRTP
jgi:hypothetical protein